MALRGCSRKTIGYWSLSPRALEHLDGLLPAYPSQLTFSAYGCRDACTHFLCNRIVMQLYSSSAIAMFGSFLLKLWFLVTNSNAKILSPSFQSPKPLQPAPHSVP